MLGGDIDKTRHEQRLAEPFAPMRWPRSRRTEPAESAIIAIVRRECAVRAILQRNVHARRIVAERALDLERPRAAELGCDRCAQRLALVYPKHNANVGAEIVPMR